MGKKSTFCQRLREHVNTALNKVDGCASLGSFIIQWSAGAYKICYISNIWSNIIKEHPTTSRNIKYLKALIKGACNCWKSVPNFTKHCPSWWWLETVHTRRASYFRPPLCISIKIICVQQKLNEMHHRGEKGP